MRLRKGFTIVELLTVIAVLSLLISLLVPSLIMARNAARNAKQRVQLAAIEQALLAFRNDDGDYPQSVVTITDSGGYYEGSQKLVEGLLGLDLLGFYPYTDWNCNLAQYTNPTFPGSDLSTRRPRYLELETANVFRVSCSGPDVRDGLFELGRTGRLVPFASVLCDVYGRFRVQVGERTERAGLPILYYRSNPSGVGLDLSGRDPGSSIYNYWDNAELVHLGGNSWDEADFYEFITDDRVVRSPGAWPWPHKPDSYILISAGVDGLYGTRDDITNFGY